MDRLEFPLRYSLLAHDDAWASSVSQGGAFAQGLQSDAQESYALLRPPRKLDHRVEITATIWEYRQDSQFWHVLLKGVHMYCKQSPRTSTLSQHILASSRGNPMRPFVHRIDSTGADPSSGRVVLDPAKALWNGGLLVSALALAPFTFTVGSLLLFLTTTYVTLLLGHSIGMHRRMIHRSFECPKWVDRTLVYIGVLVGMAGPFGLLRIHDIRDWAQREPQCHDFFAHRRSLLVDALWQLTCRFEFAKPPRFSIEHELAADPWYRWLERTWMLQQLPVAVVLFALGGLPWVVWGVSLRVSVSVTGHWVVTYLTHNPGPGDWQVPGAGVQASNLSGYGFLTMGECWHNNHHAFPESAQIGLLRGETDPGWWVIRCMQRIGLVTHVGVPRRQSEREDIAWMPHASDPLGHERA